ncbi:MAG: sterol desaturase family protein [Flavobacteriaceae bacterium]|jgi:sterol desaturase/sphingolipid hydroxylase (fatty acid hydroxylase superfamily)|nr:sterol desaturase family protein [Flavobacteriaceae bacterium]
MEMIRIFWESILGTLNWTLNSILFQLPWYKNYFWGLILISILAWGLEIAFPWRKKQGLFRKDFWLDGFYMFFNFFLFSIVISGFYEVLQFMFSEVGLTSKSLVLFDLSTLPETIQLIVFFIILDFVQWVTHILLHKIPILWQFHKIHHSVKEMGFAAHLRYHWMENLLYKPLKTFGVMILGGFEPDQAYIIHFIAITIGHLNHSNIKLSWGPLKYLLNNPIMHLHHHAFEIPKGKIGVNFGISLSVWDYLFKTNHIPNTDGDLKLGFPGDENLPNNFFKQLHYGFKKTNR